MPMPHVAESQETRMQNVRDMCQTNRFVSCIGLLAVINY